MLLPEKFFKVEDEQMLETTFLKRNFKNPIGLAAGFDKSAEVIIRNYSKFGFGFIEVGTVTPRKQFGNPKPRIFRLEDDEALINRLGFNNDGMDTIMKRLNRKELILHFILESILAQILILVDQKNDFCLCLFNIMKRRYSRYMSQLIFLLQILKI